MLRELHISNLAVIAEAHVELDVGLNCFTGATGAGKSLVIGAIELLLGLRSPTDMLRAGASEGRVSGMFEVRDVERLRRIDAITDLSVSENAKESGEVLVVRKLHSSGRSTASLNGSPITLQMLKQIGETLVDVHGQHDSQYLLKPSNQLDVLDRFADADVLRSEYYAVYTELAETKRKLADLMAGEALRRQQLELLQFKADEIDKADLDPAEHAELETRSTKLENVERLRRESTSAHAALYDADESVVDRLKVIHATLADLAGIDPELKEIEATVRSGVIQLEEAAFDLGRYAQKLDLDPAELAEVNERLNVINRLLRKYGVNVEQVLAVRASVQADIDRLSGASFNAESLMKQVAPLESKLVNLGQKLSEMRRFAAQILGPKVQAQLGELLMEKAKFEVQLSQADAPTASGLDVVEYMVQTNPGLPKQAMRKIASGGELGRIMLAIKSVLAADDHAVPGEPSATVLVFDEIDANIGGRLGAIIGAKLRQLSARHQVLCITHLPQIACYADRHLTVRKEQSGTQTQTTVRPMQGEERIQEIAEMIGGKTVTATTRAQAKELLDHAAAEARPGKAKVQVTLSPVKSRQNIAKKR
jgi:DNA repair protein RecN (Recombination protein N)